jgi:hypothetical protein
MRALEDTPTIQSEPRPVVTPEAAPSRKPRLQAPVLLGFVAGLVGVVALGASAWIYTETRRDMGRLATDIAQIKLSLELFNRQQSAVPAPVSGDTAALTELNNRLSLLEENWRSGAALANAPTALPPIAPSSAAAGVPVPTDGDCLPTGTRFMVAAGDVYPVCGTPAKVEIGGVDDGYITLSDGTVIAQGGTVGLPASQCMIAVVPSEGGAISGFAEIRVTC